MPTMPRPRLILGLLIVMTLVVPATRAAAAGVRVSIACGALGVELALCREAAEE